MLHQISSFRQCQLLSAMKASISCTSVQRSTSRIDPIPFLFHHSLLLLLSKWLFLPCCQSLIFHLDKVKAIFCGCLCELLLIFFLSYNRNAHLSLKFPGCLLICGTHAVTQKNHFQFLKDLHDLCCYILFAYNQVCNMENYLLSGFVNRLTNPNFIVSFNLFCKISVFFLQEISLLLRNY